MALPPTIDPKIARLRAARLAREATTTHVRKTTARQRGILGLDDDIIFGKHKGQSVSEVILSDPSWLVWALDEIDDFVLSDEAEHELALSVGRDPDADWRRHLK